MAPFSAVQILDGIKEKVDAVFAQGDKLFIASGTTTMRVYRIQEQEDQTISFYDSSTLTLLTTLTQTRGAQTFAIHTSVSLDSSSSNDPSSSSSLSTSPPPSDSVPTITTTLLVGLKKRLLLFRWSDGSSVPSPDPLLLPHTPRSMAFVTPNRVVAAYTSSEQVVIALDPMRVLGEVAKAESLPEGGAAGAGGAGGGGGGESRPMSVASGLGGLGLGGMGGYMGLGTGKGKASVVRVAEGEVLVGRDNVGVLVASNGSFKRPQEIEWPLPPEDTVFAHPFLLSVLPPLPTSLLPLTSTSPALSSLSTVPTIQIRSVETLTNLQTFHLPPSSSLSSAHTIHHLTPSAASSSMLKPPLYFVTTPTERAAFASEGGSRVWCLRMKEVGEVVEELMVKGEYEEGLAVLKGVDERVLGDKVTRQTLLQTLSALTLFRTSPTPQAAQTAIETFISLSINPAKVIALFPEVVSGRFFVPEEEWVELFGGPSKETVLKYAEVEAAEAHEEGGAEEGGGETGGGRRGVMGTLGTLATFGLNRPESIFGGAGEKVGEEGESGGNGNGNGNGGREKVLSAKEKMANQKLSYEALLHYLSDRRQKVLGALAQIPPSSLTPLETSLPPLSAIPKEELLSMPSIPLSRLTPEQVFRVAQVVDTALFKLYLVVRPSLVGSLCRLENFCEVVEVEEQLKERKKYSDLVDLYRTRKNHEKALKLLRELGKDDPDPEDKLDPTIRYLLALGPKYLPLIFETSRWVFEENFDWAMKIFTADPDTVEPLPRHEVLVHLETVSPRAAVSFLEFLIEKLGEKGAEFHDRLAELYLEDVKKGKKSVKEEGPYAKALKFLKSSNLYRPDHVLRYLPDDDLFEARAILLGRLGNHEAALQIYVYRLADYSKAEEYCVRVYQSTTPSTNIFLPLLRIYLLPRPSPNTNADSKSKSKTPATTTTTTPLLIPPALSLIATHSTKLEPLEVISLLPPLLTMQDVHSFFLRTLREGKAKRNDGRVLREIEKTRGEELDWRLLRLQERRVRIGDTRICPQCKKRLGNSVIAVHSPRGEVTHLHCKDAFSLKLREAAGV
ncbi:hypothetical protein BDY24DRAFT_412023 [Mrakia frigida]|uniref:Vam6p n=1 Tax=Mrakia frigida TaxID=29902 RepID=UPI003FCC114E